MCRTSMCVVSYPWYFIAAVQIYFLSLVERQRILHQGLEKLPFISKKLKFLVIPSSDIRTSGARSRGREMKVVQSSTVCILIVCEFTFMRRNRKRK